MIRGRKMVISIPNRLYGPSLHVAYENAGLAAMKVSQGWTIAVPKLESYLSGNLLFRTLKDACEFRDVLLANTPNVDWANVDERLSHPEIEAIIPMVRKRCNKL